ncbi:chemotaxis protein CheB [Mycobacterium sp. 94-17]|uniref:chemotaxis protein CheB n=1 Tax=Mycobacterium sp. 94-17 TaxID=2986147 RepID=UPI002D1E78A8|nr:chemotaxis protein CheB [Mycobacterium sp. 94-17]MEB4210168.1 chemotaxis protein CheB [Mycobacterium sp. 94-17]
MAIDTHGPGVTLVALLASAGGLEALSTVLGDLPPDLPAAVIVQQHLGGHTSVLPTILSRLTGRSIGWATEGRTLRAGDVAVCPPGMLLELTPNGRCRLHNARNHGSQGADAVLASIAGSYGPRCVAVVLSGSGHDGAAGTVAMKRAGATVIAQSPKTAQYPSMPIAAARAGADLVVDVGDIAGVLAGIVMGTALPPRREPPTAVDQPDAALASYDILDRLPAKFSANSAAARGELARLRAAELERRRKELTLGLGATHETVAVARRRAEESRCRAQLAHQAAEEASTRNVTPRQRG